MKKFLFVFFICALFGFTEPIKQKRHYKNNGLSIDYETTDARLNGVYTSYYKNGKTKATGTFENNYRIGKWSVWDSTGRLRMQRHYTSPFHFKRLVPKVPKDKPVQLLIDSKYEIKYNFDNYINYSYLKEANIFYSARMKRYLSPNDNPILFQNKRLFKIINDNVFKSNITAFSPKNDEFIPALALNQIDTNTIELLGFKTKEDWFFDSERMVCESRILGICPIVVNTINKDTSDLFWIYFPELRKYLAQATIVDKKLPLKIKTIDDLFFYRCYYGLIYRFTNTYENSKIHSSQNGFDNPINSRHKTYSEEHEIFMIEKEHDIWMQFAK